MTLGIFRRRDPFAEDDEADVPALDGPAFGPPPLIPLPPTVPVEEGATLRLSTSTEPPPLIQIHQEPLPAPITIVCCDSCGMRKVPMLSPNVIKWHRELVSVPAGLFLTLVNFRRLFTNFITCRQCLWDMRRPTAMRYQHAAIQVPVSSLRSCAEGC